MKHGIKELTEALEFGYTGFVAFSKANEDGKVNWMDLALLVPMISKASAGINGIKKIKDELLDLDDAEQAEIVALTKRFYANLSDAECVELIESTVDWVIDGVQTAIRWSNLNKKEVLPI